MARMLDDNKRSRILNELLSKQGYDDNEGAAATAFPGGEDQIRGTEQRDINRAMPAKPGSNSRRLNSIMENYDNLKRDAAPGSDSDVEADEELEEMQMPQRPGRGGGDVPNNDMDRPIFPQKPRSIEDADHGNDMVQVPRSMVNMAMATLMQNASRNSIGKSMGEDGAGPVRRILDQDTDDGGEANVNAVTPLDEAERDPRTRRIRQRG